MPWVKFVFNGKTVAKYHTAGGKAAKKAYDKALIKAAKGAYKLYGGSGTWEGILNRAERAALPTPTHSPSPPCSDEEERMEGSVIRSWAV